MSGDLPDLSPDLAALIGSRICHDLISPIGAIGNGVELLTMSGAGEGAELALISESVDNANARIRFFRIAFGMASEGQAVGRAEVLAILTDLYRGSRLKVHWGPADDCPRREVKVAFLLLQCLESAMPYGGQIRITRTDRVWQLDGEAEKLKMRDDLWAALEGTGAVEVSAAQVHFALVPEALSRLGRRLRLERGERRISATF